MTAVSYSTNADLLEGNTDFVDDATLKKLRVCIADAMRDPVGIHESETGKFGLGAVFDRLAELGPSVLFLSKVASLGCNRTTAERAFAYLMRLECRVYAMDAGWVDRAAVVAAYGAAPAPTPRGRGDRRATPAPLPRDRPALKRSA